MRAIKLASLSSAATRAASSSWSQAANAWLLAARLGELGRSRNARFNCMDALHGRRRLEVPAAKSLNDLAELQQISKSANTSCGNGIVGARQGFAGVSAVPIRPCGRNV